MAKGLSGLGFSALGGLIDGFGMVNVAEQVSIRISNTTPVAKRLLALNAVQTVQTAHLTVPDIVIAGGNPLSELTSPGSELLNELGSDSVLGSGALTGAIGASFSNITGNDFATELLEHSDNIFGASCIHCIQAFTNAETFSYTSKTIGSNATALENVVFGNETTPDNGFNSKPLGKAISNTTDSLTNGLTTLVNSRDDLGVFAEDLNNLGLLFDVSDLHHLGNPGQLIYNLAQAGGAGITGISAALKAVDISEISSDLVNDEFNDILNSALASITNPEMIRNAQLLMDSDVSDIQTMADFTDIKKVTPNSFDKIPFNTFHELRTQLLNLDVGAIKTFADLGFLLNNTAVVNLSSLDELPVVDAAAVAVITDKFLGGTGPNDSITTSDLIGSVSGIGLNSEIEQYLLGISDMETLNMFTVVNDMYNEIIAGVAGTYTTGTGVYSVDTIIDPRDSSIHADLDSFINNKVSQITAELINISTDPTSLDAFQVAKQNYELMQSKISNEITNQAKVNLYLDSRTTDVQHAYNFINSFSQLVTKTDAISVIDGMALAAAETGNIYGQYLQAFIAESRNKHQARVYDINWRSEPDDQLF